MPEYIPDVLKLSLPQWIDILFDHKNLVTPINFRQYSNHDLFLQYSSFSLLDLNKEQQQQFWDARPYKPFQKDPIVEKIIYLKELSQTSVLNLDLLLYLKNLKSFADITETDISQKKLREIVSHDLSILLTPEKIKKFVIDLGQEKSPSNTVELLSFIKKLFRPKESIDYYKNFEKTIYDIHQKLEGNLIKESIDTSDLKPHKIIQL